MEISKKGDKNNGMAALDWKILLYNE